MGRAICRCCGPGQIAATEPAIEAANPWCSCSPFGPREFLVLECNANKNAFIDLLGFRLSEHIVTADGSEVGAWIRTTALAHDVALMQDATGSRGRLHHVCYWYGYPQHLMDIADLFAENNIKIEAGPGKHGSARRISFIASSPAATGSNYSGTPAISSLIRRGSRSDGPRRNLSAGSFGSDRLFRPSSSAMAHRLSMNRW